MVCATGKTGSQFAYTCFPLLRHVNKLKLPQMYLGKVIRENPSERREVLHSHTKHHTHPPTYFQASRINLLAALFVILLSDNDSAFLQEKSSLQI